MRIASLAWCLFFLLGASLQAAEPAPVAPWRRAPMTYASKLYDGAWLTTWIEATKAAGYGAAAAHSPNFADRGLWPAVTDEDGVPAYKTSVWPKARLLVWARRDEQAAGRQVDVTEPSNWLEDGKPATDGPDADTDIIFPDSDKRYWVLCSSGDKFERGFAVRHITVGTNAELSFFGLECNGNWWIKKGGSIYERHGGAFFGKHNTFARNDNTPAWRPCPMPRPPTKTQAEWPFTQENSQYFHVKKPGAILEIVGNFSSQDQFHIDAGTMIVGPDSYLGTGGRATLIIHEEGVLQLQSGAAVAKLWAQNNVWDVEVKGALRAGSPERPLHREAMLGLSAKEYAIEFNQWNRWDWRVSMMVVNKGTISVTQAKPDARLRIQWSGVPQRALREKPEKDDAESKLNRFNAEHFSNTITMHLRPDQVLEHVYFDDIRFGGLAGPSLDTIKGWKDVTFGLRNEGPVEQLIAPSDWRSSLTLLPAGPLASLPAGQPALCTILSSQPEATVFYTTDGSEPTVTSAKYDKPFPLTGTCMIKARLFCDGKPRGVTARSDYFSQDKPLPAAATGGKQPGIAYTAGTFRERSGQRILEGKQEKSAPTSGVADSVKVIGKEPWADANFGMRFSGFLTIPKDGVYTLWITCAGHPDATVRLGDLRICQKTCNAGETNSNAIALAKGAHAFTLDYSRSYWGDNALKFEWQGPGIPRQEIPASAFTH